MSSTQPPRRPHGRPPTRPPLSVVARIAVLAVFAILAATWALVRHESVAPAPLRVPRPAPAPTYDPDSGEIPVPDIVDSDQTR